MTKKKLIYPDFFERYISKIETDINADVLLEEGMRATMTTFKFLSDEKAKFRYAEGKWSVQEVLGHMIDTERIMAYRALCIARGEQQSLPGFDEDSYVALANFDQLSLGDMLEQYKMVRFSNILMTKSLTEEMLDRKGIANGKEINARALLYIIAGHEKHHLQILKERYGVK
jgi:uncharacterized damage-inducible protein DinB